MSPIAPSGHYELIAREAYPYAIPPALLALIFWWFDVTWLSFIFLFVACTIAFFFRNPSRETPPGDNLVVSPADGRVVEITENISSENLTLSPLKRVSIFMSLFNAHVNRSPISATVARITHKSGDFLDARNHEASERNEQKSLVMEGEIGTIEVVQVAGLVARKISSWIHEGMHVRRGERIGVVHFGSRLDVYLPQDFQLRVSVGNTVRAGSTIIAEKPRQRTP